MANAYTNKDFEGRAGFFHGMKEGCRYIESKVFDDFGKGAELGDCPTDIWWDLRGIDLGVKDNPKARAFDKGFRMSCRYFNSFQKLLVTDKMFSDKDYLKAVREGSWIIRANDKYEENENRKALGLPLKR